MYVPCIISISTPPQLEFEGPVTTFKIERGTCCASGLAI